MKGGAEFINKGFYCLMDELPRERLLIADQALCHLENAFELTREYTKEWADSIITFVWRFSLKISYNEPY